MFPLAFTWTFDVERELKTAGHGVGFYSPAHTIESPTMSQYPSPYYPPNVQPPYVPYTGPGDALAPARRASTMMFILGGLLTALGLCETIQAFVVKIDDVMKQEHQFLGNSSGAAQMPMTSEQLKIFLIVVSFLFIAIGVSFILLAVGVRRGGKTSTVLATILTGLIVAGLALTILLMLVASLQAPQALGFVCILLIPVALLVPLTIWLIGALRAQPNLSNAQQQYMAQYWQYQQNMQAYSGYGYAGQVQQPEPNPPPALPPADPAPPAPPPVEG
jgi:hypothetical protein